MGFLRDGNTARALPYPEPEFPDKDTEVSPSPVQEQPHHTARLEPTDWVVAAVLTLSVSIACFFIAESIPAFLLQSMDFWFESDTVREVSNMTSTTDDHSRTSVHPLFSILSFVPVYLVQHALAIPPLQAVLYVTSILGGLWMGTLYLLLRLLGCRTLDASVFTSLGLSSASAIFWLPVPNSYTWGSWSVMISLALLLLAEQHRVGALSYVLASAFTLSITVTNWMAGLLTTLARWPFKQAVQLSINAFCLVVLLWGAQKFIFPSAEFFIGSRKEANWINHPQSGQASNIASSFAFHTFIAPAIRFIDDDGYIQVGDDSVRLAQRLAFQFSTPGSAGPLGLIAVCLWSALLLNGLWRLVTMDRQLRFRLVLATLLLFELSLHMVYGEETFTYSLNFTPLLIALAALGTLSPGRPAVLVLAGLLALCAGINNWQQFRQATESATHFTPQRDAMNSLMQNDPDRPWPRSVGHIPLAVPGAPEAEHAYHEPGGDFSPQAPSFGVSLWLCDAEGRPLVTSQSVPLNDIQQTFEPSTHPHVPAIATRTPYYDATWTRLDATHWELRFKNHTSHTPAIMIRSVGPAGGPVTELGWDGEQLDINHRWTVRVTPAPAKVSLGDEQTVKGMTSETANRSWTNSSGWGYARLALPGHVSEAGEEYRLILSDLRIPIQMQRWYRNAPEQIHLDLPDKRFEASLAAQTTHLMMSLIGRETRPGDPIFFYRAWQRQGAYIATALARAGDPRVSRVLAQYLATHDFAGGNGPEADAPGLTIWALTTSADYIADHEHDQWLWPHVLRKAQRIEAMLTARAPIEESFAVPSPYDLQHGQQIRRSVLAKPSRDGLIVGRVGDEWPSLYVNAVSYRGLLAAAEFAERLGKHRNATGWRNHAHTLRDNWQRRNRNGASDAKISTVSLGPSASITSNREQLGQALTVYRPSPDTATVATQLSDAHLALRQGRPDAVWAALHRLWTQQASPGLYTWDMPRPATTDVADGWQYVRGWRNQSVVSPDYETAALLLLLQQDMLAYVDDGAAEPTVVIGAGVPQAWISHSMTVSNLALPGGSIDWRWDGHAMRVTLRGPSRKIQLGASFPDDTDMSVTHDNRAADVTARVS